MNAEIAPSGCVAVVGGIAVRDGRILLAQRPPYKQFPFTWECPGGKVDLGESYHEALYREWREELGVQLLSLPERSIWSGEFPDIVIPGRGHVFLFFYFIGDHFMGDPYPNEDQGFGWFSRDEMFALNLAPGNLAARDTIAHHAFGGRQP